MRVTPRATARGWPFFYNNTNREERTTMATDPLHQAGQRSQATDQVSFYDESLKKQIEGTFVSDGRDIHVSSEYGTKIISYSDLGANIDYNSQVLLVQKVLSEMARDPGSSEFKELSQQKDDQQGQPMQKSYVGGQAGWGSSGGSGTNP